MGNIRKTESKKSTLSGGFTIVEIMVVVVVLAILAALIYNSLANYRERSYMSRAESDLRAVSNAVTLYGNAYNTYPPDTTFGIPVPILEFIDKDHSVAGEKLKKGPWPNSTYDYEAWDVYDAANNTYGHNVDGINETFQVSVRFCRNENNGDLTTCHFPKQPWASNFTVHSSVYYCIKGYCNAWRNKPYDTPGYCLNCPGNKSIPPPNAPYGYSG